MVNLSTSPYVRLALHLGGLMNVCEQQWISHNQSKERTRIFFETSYKRERTKVDIA